MQKYAAALIVDDDLDVLRAARIALAAEFESVVTVASIGAVDQGCTRLDVVLLDMNFAAGQHSGQVGLSALAQLRERDPALTRGAHDRFRQRGAGGRGPQARRRGFRAQAVAQREADR